MVWKQHRGLRMTSITGLTYSPVVLELHIRNSHHLRELRGKKGPLGRARFRLSEEGEGKRILLLMESGIWKRQVEEFLPLDGLGEWDPEEDVGLLTVTSARSSEGDESHKQRCRTSWSKLRVFMSAGPFGFKLEHREGELLIKRIDAQGGMVLGFRPQMESVWSYIQNVLCLDSMFIVLRASWK